MIQTHGRDASWRVHEIEINGVPQLGDVDLPGYLFSSGAMQVPKRPGVSPRLGIRGAAFMVYLYLDHVHKGDEIALTVSYDGKNPEGEVFFGSAIGSGRKPETLIEIETPILRKTTITITPTNTDRYSLRAMEIQGDAHNWHVHDIRIGGVTQLSQAGSLPGDLFASAAIESYVSIAPCLTGDAIEFDIEYVGKEPAGEPFIMLIDGDGFQDGHEVPEILARVTLTP